MRDANILACAIGLPGGDEWSGLRLGTPEIVRWGMTADDMPELAALIVEASARRPEDGGRQDHRVPVTIHDLAPHPSVAGDRRAAAEA